MVNVDERSALAMKYFTEGYNCSQSVVLAYSDVLNQDKELLAKISAPFGGGMGRLREVCGAVSGMFMVSGFVCDASNPTNREAKKRGYEAVQSLAHKFSAENGSIVCRELLGLTVKSQEPTPEARTDEYYKKRPCKELVGMAARFAGELINQKETK